MINWTDNQRAAIETRGNLLVSAAAGAGKTAVLTERVVSLVLAGTGIDRVLVLTFTRAAAAEMKERISQRLDETLRNAQIPDSRFQIPEKLAAYLREQIDMLSGASISTIDSFCDKVVSRHFHLVGLSPSARTVDETQSAVLRAAALEESLLDCAGNRPETYRLLVGAFGDKKRLAEQIAELTRFLQTQPEPKRWLSELVEGLDDPARAEAMQAAYLAGLKEELRQQLEQVRAMRDSLPSGFEKLSAHIDTELPRLWDTLERETPARYADALDMTFEDAPDSKGCDEAIKKRMLGARTELRNLVRTQCRKCRRALYNFPRAQELGAQVTRALCEETQSFLAVYRAHKHEENARDYGDLEHYALEILQRPEVAEEYRRRYEAIIIDEYQDSNRVQERILAAIRRPDNLYYVGDVKQSIYGFRQADPSLFLEKARDFRGEAGQVVHLNANFRSTRAVIDAVNRVFETIMLGEDGLAYDADAALHLGREPKEGEDAGTCELHLIETEAGDPDEDLTAAEAEALFAAKKIRELMDRHAYQFKDFVVLLRTSTHMRAWAQTLAAAGIPCFVQLTGGYFDAIEVQVLENLLRVLDNRRQDIPLLSVLRCGFGGFSDAELVKIRQADKEGNFIDCLLKCRAGAGVRRVEKFLAWLDRLYEQSKIKPVAELIADILDETAYYEEMGAMPGGAQRQANLNALVDKARAFGDAGGFGVHGFLRYMAEAKKSANVGASPTDTGDVVRIMTVHKAKGLEFPVVFLGGLGQKFSSQDSRKSMLAHSDLGLGLKLIDRRDGVTRDSMQRAVILAAEKRAQWQEEMRVLYVAMTRARARLYLIGSLKNAADELANPPFLTAQTIAGANKFLTWLRLAFAGQPNAFVHTGADLADAEPAPLAPLSAQDTQNLSAALAAHLNWRYPHEDVTGLPNKLSVSALSDSEPTFAQPVFAAPKETAASRGT
ncbi:MAG: UvrD-helicase domain-containing protein, partial [Clostridiales bacterium]|nr:UvrD-helicase domain-containing protein [Clostridiales bacterium]